MDAYRFGHRPEEGSVVVRRPTGVVRGYTHARWEEHALRDAAGRG
jgi:hypothetical protein